MTETKPSLTEAIVLGLDQYYTGKPCKHGHLANRYVSNNECVECRRLKNTDRAVRKKYTDRINAKRRHQWANDPEYRARVQEKNRKWYNDNKDKINKARRERWANDPEWREERLAPRRGRCQKASNLKHLYGLSVEEYNEMKENQNHRCAICQKKTDLCVDHCHNKGHVRALLCRKCNTGLGCFDDDQMLLDAAADYLHTWRRC